jgi:Ca-activated chloride channel homolog
MTMTMNDAARALAFAALAFGAAACGQTADTSGGGVGLGGAQDIGEFRAILAAGEIPGEETLDAGGFFAEHYSELPPADCGDALCLVGAIAIGRDWVTGEDRAFLQVSLSTPIDPDEAERVPLDLVVVVDTSGSMIEEDRIGYARAGLHALIDELDEGDRLALVTYSDEVQVRADLAEPLARPALHAAVDELVAEGATNLHDGLERGFQIGLAALDPARQTRVLLVSDGLPTIGVVDDAVIQEMADRYVSDGIALNTVGVGLDFNLPLMRGLAERGAGNFYFLEDPSAIAEVFREELETSVAPLALDVQLDVAAETGWRIGEVIGTRQWVGSDRSGSMSLPAVFAASRAGDQPGEYGRRGAGGSLFFSMVPTRGSVWDARSALAVLNLGYRLPGEESRRTLGVPVIARPPGGSRDEVYLSAEAVAEHYSMLSFYLGLREATRHAQVGGYDCALAALEGLDDAAARWQAEYDDPDIEADRAIVARFESNLRERGAVGVDSFEASCAGYGGPGYYPEPYACSAGGGASLGPAFALLIGLAWTARRSRGGARAGRRARGRGAR